MARPRTYTDGQRAQVIELRRRHSAREVASITGLPLGTVKTLCSRSGAFQDNAEQRALFTLPPIRPSAETLPAVPELPHQERITGDVEVDAVLWLHKVIGTGEAHLIERAMEAAKRIETPLADLEKRYTRLLAEANPGNLFATFASFGFAELEGKAKKAVKDRAARIEAFARFDDPLADTEAERFCIRALEGAGMDEHGIFIDKDQAAARFRARPELMPHTLADCLHELAYWDDLYRLRNVIDRYCSEGPREATARERFVFGLLAEIRPRSRDEAKAVLRYLVHEGRMDQGEVDAILENIIS